MRVNAITMQSTLFLQTFFMTEHQYDITDAVVCARTNFVSAVFRSVSLETRIRFTKKSTTFNHVKIVRLEDCYFWLQAIHIYV